VPILTCLLPSLKVLFVNFLYLVHTGKSSNLQPKPAQIIWLVYKVIHFVVMDKECTNVRSLFCLIIIPCNHVWLYSYLQLSANVKPMHIFAKHKSPLVSVLSFCSCDKVYNKQEVHSFVLTRSDCYLLIIILIHWIKNLPCTVINDQDWQ